MIRMIFRFLISMPLTGMCWIILVGCIPLVTWALSSCNHRIQVSCGGCDYIDPFVRHGSRAWRCVPGVIMFTEPAERPCLLFLFEAVRAGIRLVMSFAGTSTAVCVCEIWPHRIVSCEKHCTSRRRSGECSSRCIGGLAAQIRYDTNLLAAGHQAAASFLTLCPRSMRSRISLVRSAPSAFPNKNP